MQRTPEPCHAGDCDKPVDARGLCRMHWKRWRKWGDPYYVEEYLTPKRAKWMTDTLTAAGYTVIPPVA